MTINRIWQCGFETKSSDEISGGRLDTQTFPRTGDWSNRLQVSGVIDWWHFYQNISATRQIRAGCVLYPGSPIGNNDGDILVVRNGLTTKLVQVMTESTTNDIQLLVGGVQKDITTDSPFILNAWNHFGIDCKIHSSLGWIKVYHNCKEILSFSGNTGNIDIDNIVFGSRVQIVSAGYWYYDDCYIDDTTDEISATTLPILRFYWIYPNETGNYDQWIGSDGNNIDNYLLIDERPPVTTDYVEEDTVDQFDSYDMTTFTLGVGQQIDAIIPIIYAQRYGTDEEIAIGTRYSSIDVIGSNQDPGFGAWKYLWERQIIKPGGGAWDQTALDGVEVVIKSRGIF